MDPTDRPVEHAPVAPPRAPKRPQVLRHGDDERLDEWYWLRDRDDPDVLGYLEAENAHTEAGLGRLAGLRERLFAEIRGRIRETDASAPVRHREWEYFTRTVEGLEYAIHCRRPAGTPGLPDPDASPGTAAGEVVILDENALAHGAPYLALRGFAVSPDQRLLAYLVDLTGGERSTLRVRDLGTGADLDDEVPDAYYGLAWANDGRTLFYVRPDAALRPWQVWRHEVGTDAATDVLVHQEDDERFYVGIDRTRTGRFVVVESASKLTTEVWLLDADDPGAPAHSVAGRRPDVEYHVEHQVHVDGDRLLVMTNAGDAPNFRLLRGPLGSDPTEWTELVPHRPEVRLEAVDAFADHLVVSERAEGLERLRVLDPDGVERHTVDVGDPVASVWIGANLEHEATAIRCTYTSLVTPRTDVDHDLRTGATTGVKRQSVAGYEPDHYETFREWAVAPDGVRVPVSVVRRRVEGEPAPAPTLLYGYGSYEISIDPVFSATRLSLLERGVTYAIAHVRGGGELGRHWYEDGKLTRKRNTFTDFLAAAEHLVACGIAAPDRLAARGGSAGGLLMGAVTNLRPERFRAVVAEVPFVDCLTTMLDEELPLTITEWDEWGDPVRDPEVYDYLRSYSPYDNVAAVQHPALLVTAGLNDPRVQYWEPAKWVARLRDRGTGDAPVYLRTEMAAGHHGPSGRYESWRDEAFVLAFVLDQLDAG